MSDDPDHIATLEKAISDKYGDDAIRNPKANWDEEKEKEYLAQMKELYQKVKKNDEWQEKIDLNGIKVSKKLFNRDSIKYCPVCGSFARTAKDDVYLIKFDCCNWCYIQYVEDREGRWIEGWRPNENNKKRP
jgi:hypothetical protein